MNGRQIRELRQLAEGLPRVPPYKFDMRSWGYGRLDPDADDFECNFAGCAFGWMPRLVPGNRLGRDGLGGPKYRGRFLYSALALYFGIKVSEAEYLFSPVHYPGYNLGVRATPAMVATRIHKFLADKGV